MTHEQWIELLRPSAILIMIALVVLFVVETYFFIQYLRGKRGSIFDAQFMPSTADHLAAKYRNRKGDEDEE